MSLLDWLFGGGDNPYSGSMCEKLGHHSFEYHYGWDAYVCLWCGKVIHKPTQEEPPAPTNETKTT